ncbi:MAG TPA: c-type cytochrome biogenesis protein CcmI [Devosia sp.]|nr:c-type cytochrome biogenesis protein CcmI [Devosia sp.]
MTFWLLAIVIAAAASAVLFYAAAGRPAAPGASAATATDDHYRRQLSEIEADVAAGELAPAEAVAAKAELAREVLRQRRDATVAAAPSGREVKWVVPGSILAILVVAFASYAFLGSPTLPSQPLAARADAQAKINIDDAIKQVEARLASNPDDLRGWQVIAPVYMQEGEYAKAEHAFRRIIALSPPQSADDTNLAEALMMQNGGQATGEAADLLHKAVALDPKDIRPRFYLAAEAMRSKDYAGAVGLWNDIIALGTDADNWMPTARAGLAAAEAGRDGKPLPGQDTTQPAAGPAAPGAAATGAANPAQSPAILAMVNQLSERLAKTGGSIDEWTRLVRSEIVLGDLAKAQAAYNAAKQAYPEATDRAELDALAAQAGLKLDGSKP